MRILSCVARSYYGKAGAIDPTYVAFVDVLRGVGHDVDHFDYDQVRSHGREEMNSAFASKAAGGSYDVAFVVTREDGFDPEVLDLARKHTVLVAWNSDDDWRWEDYSSRWYPHFSFMVTTYRHIYETNRQRYPNLLLSQWACFGLHDGRAVPKDIDLGFVGQAHGDRLERLRYISKHVPVAAFGSGTARLRLGGRLRAAAGHRFSRLLKAMNVPWAIPTADGPLTFEAVYRLWNRTRVSFTPLQASLPGYLQIKSRVFEMGLSGTVMLCDRNPALYEFLEPGKEFVEFVSLDECVERARFLISHESERKRIADAYSARVIAEHMWSHRFDKLFRDMGLAA